VKLKDKVIIALSSTILIALLVIYSNPLISIFVHLFELATGNWIPIGIAAIAIWLIRDRTIKEKS